ncbi:prostatic steroid-binding protein C1-like [Rattus norvegicus]|uniref:prostatic steroid-binding protein C1-like n=1 Tax=Rattus norvegicus TaxID=10116 RepID=UPI0001CF3E84|nr:prostatic steroid-binding protein C1-like isoform X1 [Rattus norvegicus]
MRLSLCLQTILVVCCYEANANHVCEAVKHEIITFILKREEELKTELENYDAPLESIEAKLKVKRCVDQMSYEDRCRVSGALVWSLYFSLSEVNLSFCGGHMSGWNHGTSMVQEHTADQSSVVNSAWGICLLLEFHPRINTPVAF